MGTQQILLIVLSVVIVGIAIAVGITMFNSQAKNSAKQAIIADMTNFAASTMAYYRTPESQGGAGYKTANMTPANISDYIGIKTSSTPANHLETDNAVYEIDNSTAGQIVFKSTPKEGQLDQTGKKPDLTLTLSTGATSISYE